jgi:two-component system chemotaxis response regulator CheB
MGRIRVLLADDSLTVRKRLREILESDPEIEVVGEAQDGREAIEICARARPDLVTMDMAMPVMGGLAATEYIMAHCPTPILIVSCSANRGELHRTGDALVAGAVDVMEKLPSDRPGDSWERQFTATVKLVSRIRVVSRRWSVVHPPGSVDVVPAPHPRPVEMVAIGASTGGPAAVAAVLASLPTSFTAPILLVVHISAPFAAVLTEWLNDQTYRPVRFGVDGEPVADGAGQVVVAAPDTHLVVRDGRVRLIGGPERHNCRPSVDVLFESVAAEYGAATAACLLTGMGRDGATGLQAIRASGGLTVAQDEASSVAWGMPGQAVALGAAELILPVAAIGPWLGAAVCASQDGRARP